MSAVLKRISERQKESRGAISPDAGCAQVRCSGKAHILHSRTNMYHGLDLMGWGSTPCLHVALEHAGDLQDYL